MHQILPEAISQQILIQETRPDGTMKEITYEGLKSGVLAFLNAMPGGTIPMLNSVEKERAESVAAEAAAAEAASWAGDHGGWGGGWTNGGSEPTGQAWEEPGTAGDAAAMYAKGKGEGKSTFQGHCHKCGKWGHSQRFCGKSKGKAKDKGSGKGNFNVTGGQWKGEGKAEGKGKGNGNCHACEVWAFRPRVLQQRKRQRGA